MRWWVTRTQPGAEATAGRLRALGHQAAIQPVLTHEPLQQPLDLTRAAAVAFTSGHGVEGFARLSPRRDLAAYVTGQATAARARAAGFAYVVSGDGGVEDLADAILADGPAEEVVWACAEQPSGDLVALLREGGAACSAQPVYRTVETDAPPPEGIGGVLIHSARAAQAVARVLPPPAAAALVLAAISEQAARPLAGHPFARVAVAPRPDEAALLGVIAGLTGPA